MATAWVGLAQRAETGEGEPPSAPAGRAAVASPATAGGAATAPLREENKITLWYLIKSGGWAMWPLGACSVTLVTLIILNFQRVSLRRMLPPATVAQIKVAAQSGDVQQLWNLTTAADSFFSKVLAAGLKQIQPADPLGSRPKMEAAIAETAGREEAKYAFFVNLYSTCLLKAGAQYVMPFRVNTPSQGTRSRYFLIHASKDILALKTMKNNMAKVSDAPYRFEAIGLVSDQMSLFEDPDKVALRDRIEQLCRNVKGELDYDQIEEWAYANTTGVAKTIKEALVELEHDSKVAIQRQPKQRKNTVVSGARIRANS
jgi:hypothetical protein